MRDVGYAAPDQQSIDEKMARLQAEMVTMIRDFNQQISSLNSAIKGGKTDDRSRPAVPAGSESEFED
ncbi:hypothetical protein OA88_22765 [Flavobacterium sp. JRM]|nr:hypothetical protein OA88_22765 [Flavobacterium sp. JRM]